MSSSKHPGEVFAGEKDFHAAFGLAILTWQMVERALFECYVKMSRTGSLDVSGATYYAQDSFGAKMRLVDAVAKTVLADDSLKDWKKLKESLTRESEHRNALAHLAAAAEFHDDHTFTLALVPPMYAPAALQRKREVKYDTAGCRLLIDRFHDQVVAIGRFTTFMKWCLPSS